MRIRAFIIANVLAILPNACPKSAEADDYDFNYGYAKGGLAALCALYQGEYITADMVGEVSMVFMTKKDDEGKNKALEAAFASISGATTFEACPLRRP
ncbi:hypothetical protein [Synechococcus sp. RS9916]|uniref:hypothetical protein n=1 Tax=Synechococcus sp. RS9916 TaxID=221359 RepID=UPI0000E5367F|nr:hypothetical protein [Synechococcus sp. RS9916]EAU74292.1 hypothetical protein RS9916_32332 [Synechococcus sp. RS9916]